jgi:hypothetical protein
VYIDSHNQGNDGYTINKTGRNLYHIFTRKENPRCTRGGDWEEVALNFSKCTGGERWVLKSPQGGVVTNQPFYTKNIAPAKIVKDSRFSNKKRPPK